MTTPRLISIGALLTAVTLFGCTSHPGILYPNERPIDGYFGSLDSAELVGLGIASYGMKHPDAIRIRWFVPVAHIRSTSPSTLVPSSDGWELVVLLGRVDVIPTAKDPYAIAGVGNYLCSAYFIRPLGVDSAGAWTFKSRYDFDIQALRVHDHPLGIEDITSYVEQLAFRFGEGDSCLTIEPGFLSNWELLFEKTPTFAYPVCGLDEENVSLHDEPSRSSR